MASTGSSVLESTVWVAPKVLAASSFARVDVDGDDRRRSDGLGPGDGRVAHSAAPDDGDRVAAAHPCGVDRGPEAGHDPASEQPDGSSVRGGHLRALPGGDERLLDKGADPQGRAEHRTVDEGHLLRRVVGGEAVPRLALEAGPALPADRSPVEDDEVAGADLADSWPDRLDDTGRLVSEQERELVVDPALAIVQVGVAHPAGLHGDERLPGSGVGDDDVDDLDGRALASGDDTLDGLRHTSSSDLWECGPVPAGAIPR